MHALARANELEATLTDSTKKIIRSSESAFEWHLSPAPRGLSEPGGTMEIIVRVLRGEKDAAAIARTTGEIIRGFSRRRRVSLRLPRDL